MNRLNLDAFKAQASETQELESLTGGILGACHSCGGPKEDDGHVKECPYSIYYNN